MQVRSTVHPSADVLQAFGLGKLDDTSAGVLMNHLDQCADCCKLVASQSGDDFLDRLRQGHGRNTTLPPANALSESVAEPKPPRPPPSNQTAIPNLPPELANNPQYDILRELGRGGMGVVYLAKNKQMDRLEVLKVVNKALLDHPGAVERFLREIRSAAKLSHANVVGAYSVPQVGDLLVFAMEYVEGQDLTAVVKAQGPLPVAHACYYVQQAALGLQHAFEKNMVHRDIKPQNLILAREGKKHIVKVLDFGLAKVMREKTEDSGLTGEGRMLGTPDYIAPEQTLDAASADIRADIYSLGCTLYYLLSGRPPFSAASLGAILLAHQMQEAKLLNLVRPEVPEELASVVRKMMAKEPAKRYQTPLEVAQALAAFIKPGAKGGTAPKSSPELSVAAPGTGTANAADTSKIKTSLRDVSGKALAKDTAAVAFESLGESVVSPKKAKRTRKATKPVAAWYRRGPVLAGVGAAVLALGLGAWLFAGIVFKTKVKTADGEAFVVLEVDQPDVEVTVDGQKISVHVPGDNKPIEIQVAPGQHKLRVRKDGFEVVSRDVELKSGKSASVRVRLEPVKAVTAAPPDTPRELPGDRTIPPPAEKTAERPAIKPDDQGFVSLFNGKDLTGWTTTNGKAVEWEVKDGYMEVSPRKGEIRTKEDFGPNFKLHVEFWLPLMADKKGQARANSGVFLQGRYEIQILDSYMNDTFPAGDVGAMYRLIAPDKEAQKRGIRRPEAWNTLDITFHSPRVDEKGMITEPGRITVILNDVTIINDATFNQVTGGALDDRLGSPGPILLQDHGAKVRFRNIKIMDLPRIKKESIDPDRKAGEEKGFVPLFNGKDLTGWKTHPKQPGNWRVLKGTGGAVLTGSGPAASHLYTEGGDYKDFHLRVEARINDGGNSGVYCRSAFGPQIPANNPWLPLGYEAQINSTHGDVNKTGSLYVGSDGALVSIREAPVPAEKWFAMEVIVEGKRIIVTVNGKTTADYTDDKQRFTNGHIALQQHDPKTVVEFRKIEIKELPPATSESPAAAKTESAKSPPPGGESALPPEAKAAAKAFEKACADAREKLLAEFDTALDRLANIKGSTEQRLKLMDAVKEEKKRFESKGLIPFSEPMRPFVAKYFASTSDAESKVHRAYNALIDAQLRAKNENMVADLRADLSNLLTVRVLARWSSFRDGRFEFIISLYSNGRIGGIDSKNSWTYGKGVLITRWPNPMAPGGVWIGTFKVSTDGKTYAGTNNDRNRPKFTGVYLKDD